MLTTQKNVTANGDVAAGSIYKTTNYNVAVTPIGELNRRYLEVGTSEDVSTYIDALKHYMQRSSNPDIRSLSQKLADAGRSDIQHYAELLKERVTKCIMRFQTSQVAQELLAHLLGDLNRRFHLQVLPAIAAKATRQEVDSLINKEVVEPVLQHLEKNVLGLNPEDILGMVFFLGGNCHLRWDPC